MSSQLIDITDVKRVGGTIEISIPRIVWVKMRNHADPALLLYNTLSNHHDRITLGECEKIMRLMIEEEDDGDLIDIFLRYNKVDIWAML